VWQPVPDVNFSWANAKLGRTADLFVPLFLRRLFDATAKTEKRKGVGAEVDKSQVR
jgi:hypothetical protein